MEVSNRLETVARARRRSRRSSIFFGLSAALLAPGSILLFQVPRQPIVPVSAGLRVLVFNREEDDAGTSRAIRDLGANVLATDRPPDPATDALAAEAGLTYLAFLTSDEIASFVRDPSRIAEARAERNLAGFYYWDSQVLEGFTSPQTQEQAYTSLKQLFPDKLVLYPTRLDPIAWSPDFLDRYFRPEFTDLVTPYFYPVGTTVLGTSQEQDAWPERLGGLLSPLAPRIPVDKGLLPVLQGFEQEGYPVSTDFLLRQYAVYRRFWPTLENAAVFAWKTSSPLLGVADRPDLQIGLCNLFRTLSRTAGCRSRRVLFWR
jgi:hypothetical protein